MAPVSKAKFYFCRDDSCKKQFSDMSNRNKHEKRFNHQPVTLGKNRKIQPLYDEKTKLWACPTVDCPLRSKFRGNIVRHKKECTKVMVRKQKMSQNKVCEYCGKTFGQKFNRDRHVKTHHESPDVDNEEDQDATLPTFLSLESESQPEAQNPNVSAISDQGRIQL